MLCGKLCKRTPERAKKLLRYVQSNNQEGIKKLISRDPDLISFEYPSHDQQTILTIACNDQPEAAEVTDVTIEVLIDLGANVTEPSKTDKWQPLHYTALQANVNKMNVILRNLSPEERNSLVYCSKNIVKKHSGKLMDNMKTTCSNNALHILLKCGNRSKQFYQCCELLIGAGVSVKQVDSNGVSPLDLMKDITDNGKMDNFNNISEDFWKCNDVFQTINLNDNWNFPDSIGDVEDVDGMEEKSSSCTILQLCCMKGYSSCVESLLRRGANPNRTIFKNARPPIWIAIKEDHEEVVKLLLQHESLKLPYNILLKLQTKYKHIKKCSQADKYMGLVLQHLRNCSQEELRKYLTHTDDLNRTALHYATQYRSLENTLKLLRMGAPLTHKDLFGHTPMHTMESSVLERFLDSCVAIPQSEEELSSLLCSLHNKKHKFSVEIDYRCLVKQKEILQESEFLIYIVKLPNMTHLVNHPVVASYLVLKWQKFKWVIYSNLFLYLIAYVSLLFYGFAFTDFSQISNGLLLGSLVLLFLRCFTQILIFRRSYIRRIDNIIDVFLMGGIIYVLASGWFKTLLNQNLLVAFSVVFLTSTFGIFMQLEHLPMFKIKVIMFKQISINFFRYMLFYMFPVLAFVFCFYKLCENDELFFQTFYDTIIMFAADSNSGYPKQFQTNPVFSHIVYVVFVVLICVILQNLLIALAVSDLQEIKREAEFIDKRERLRYIINIERIINKKYQNSSSAIFKAMFKKLIRLCNVFKKWKEPILVVQPYNNGCVFVKDADSIREYIQDQNVVNHLENIFKNSNLHTQDVPHSFTLKTLFDKLQIMEHLIRKSVDARIKT